MAQKREDSQEAANRPHDCGDIRVPLRPPAVAIAQERENSQVAASWPRDCGGVREPPHPSASLFAQRSEGRQFVRSLWWSLRSLRWAQELILHQQRLRMARGRWISSSLPDAPIAQYLEAPQAVPSP